MELPLERTRYQSSGKVDWPRLVLLSPLLAAAALGVAWGLSWAFVCGWYYVVVTPAIGALLVGLAARIIVAYGHCRSKPVAAILGGGAGLIAFVGYFYMHMIAVLGPGAIGRLDDLPGYIRFRMANDAIIEQRPQAPNEVLNWSLNAVQLSVVVALAASLSVARSGRAYCESCRSWLRRQVVNTPPGTSRALHEALLAGSLASVQPPGLFQMRVGKAVAFVELEYCPHPAEADARCPSYLTLKESYKGANGRPKVDKVAVQWELSAIEFRQLAEMLPAFRAAPRILTAAGPSGVPPPPTALAVRQEISPGSSYPLDTAGQNTWLFFLSLIPLFALAGGLGLLYLAWFGMGQQPPMVHLLIGVCGLLLAIPGGTITWFNVDFFNHLYLFRYTRTLIGSRADAWVSPEDPSAVYVAISPRKHWGLLGRVTDRGFLIDDPKRSCILYEGIQERYRIPAASILSCEIESRVSGGSLYTVVLRAWCQGEAAAQEWEIPFVVSFRGWGKNRAITRLKQAVELQEWIERLRESSQ